MKQINNFAVLSGPSTIKNDEIHHVEPEKDPLTDIKSDLFSEIRTDCYFSNGIIEFKAKFKDVDSGCMVALSSTATPNNPTTIGLSYNAKKFIINANTVSSTSSLSKYDIKKELNFKIEVIGSETKLFINNILLCEANSSLLSSPITFRLSGKDVKVYDIKYENIKPKVFIIMQFTDEYNILYNDVIRPVCNIYNLECVRADEFYTSTPIIKDIIDNITSASIIIAEITPDNPNVFYEIGYAHAINKPTILLCDRKREKLPFDVSSFRTLFYENSIGGKNKVEADLKKFIESITKR